MVASGPNRNPLRARWPSKVTTDVQSHALPKMLQKMGEPLGLLKKLVPNSMFPNVLTSDPLPFLLGRTQLPCTQLK